MSEMTLTNLLNTAIENENLAQSIYAKTRSLFSHIPEVTEFFSGMMEDELNHAKILETIRDSLTEADLRKAVNHQEWNIVKNLNQALGNMSRYQINNLDDAFEMTHELEASEINYFLIDLIGRYVSDEALRVSIITKIIEHQEKMLHLVSLMGTKSNRLQAVARSA